jgi:hypothetical protein
MPEARFDPGGFYQFDVAQGSVRTRDGHRVLVLSDTTVAHLVSAALERGDVSALTALGRSIAGVAKAALREAGSSSPETVLAHASAALSLFGFGRLGLERWGSVLVVTVDGLPRLDGGNRAAGALVGGLMSELSNRQLVCVAVGDTRFVVVDPSVAGAIEQLAQSGADIATIAGRLGGAQ